MQIHSKWKSFVKIHVLKFTVFYSQLNQARIFSTFFSNSDIEVKIEILIAKRFILHKWKHSVQVNSNKIERQKRELER